ADVAEAFQHREELAPGAPRAALVRHQLLLLDRHALALGGDGAVHLEHAAGGLVALGDQRAPGPDLPDVLHAHDARRQANLGQLPDPFRDHPRQRPDFAVARLAALGLAEVRAVRRGVEPADRAAG